MKKKLLIAAAVILVVLAGMFFTVTNGLSEGAKVQLTGINLSGVADGHYTGVYVFKRWTNTVVVHVKDHKVTAIDIERDMAGAQITNCSGELFHQVIKAQDTTVDAVSGATVTSKAYLKAIENAFGK